MTLNPASIHLFKVNNRNTRRMCEICSKLKIKTPERRPAFILNFQQISHILLVFPLITLNKWLTAGRKPFQRRITKATSQQRCWRYYQILYCKLWDNLTNVLANVHIFKKAFVYLRSWWKNISMDRHMCKLVSTMKSIMKSQHVKSTMKTYAQCVKYVLCKP